MAENKKPMTKAKKEFIAGFIWLGAAILFIITGAIMLTMNKSWELIFGVVVLCCGCAIVGFATYMIIKNHRIMKFEKSA